MVLVFDRMTLVTLKFLLIMLWLGEFHENLYPSASSFFLS